MMNDSCFIWLSNWYHKQCDGDWEHENGVKIGTIDNPGWFLKISLSGTELFDKELKPVEINRSQDDWIYCTIKNGMFEGFGGLFNLLEIIDIFRKWAEEN